MNIPAELHLGLRRALSDLEFDEGFKTTLTEVVTAALDATCQSADDVRRLVDEHRGTSHRVHDPKSTAAAKNSRILSDTG